MWFQMITSSFSKNMRWTLGVVEDDPINFRQAMESSNSQKWIAVMKEEIKSMKDNDVWNLVPLREGGMSIDCKWIFKTKGDYA